MVVLVAFISMLAQDLLETMKYIAANRKRPVLTGLLDSAMWLCWFVSSSIAIGSEALHGWTGRTIAIVIGVSAANFIGCASGVKLGDRFIHNAKEL